MNKSFLFFGMMTALAGAAFSAPARAQSFDADEPYAIADTDPGDTYDNSVGDDDEDDNDDTIDVGSSDDTDETDDDLDDDVEAAQHGESDQDN